MIRIHVEHPSLPTELFDSILNHLSDDKSSLRLCCLASRSFLPTAQALLFRRVVLYASPTYERPHFCAGTKLRHLIELSHLLSHTRELQINGSGIAIDNERWLSIDTELVPALEAFISLKNNHITAECGHSLQYISLKCIDWHMSSPNPLNATFQRLLALESVTHIMIGFSDMPLNIFENFPSGLKILELANNDFQNSEPTKQVADGYSKLVNLPAIHPESLIIRQRKNFNELARVIFNNPSRGCDGTSIRTFDVTGLKAHEFGTFVTFVPHVENLSITLLRAQEPYNLGQLSRLRYLYVRAHASRTGWDIRWLAQSLRHLITGNSFRSITLIYISNEIHDVLAYAELDSVLAGSQFEPENFSGMTIQVSKNLPSTNFYSLLPRTVDKKLLKVVKAGYHELRFKPLWNKIEDT